METSKKNLKYVNLKGFRVVNELSQKEIAEYLEVSIAFISAVERGQAKLPADKFLRLIENDQDWETAPLLDQGDRGTRVHNDHRNISNNIEGEFHNNNYNGFSDEEFERELSRRTELKDQQIAALESEIASLRLQLDREISRNERLMGILEKGEFHKAEK